MQKDHHTLETPRVIIIGAGIGGLITAIALKTKLGFSNFTVYEQGSDVGGTWHWNTYPGCASDIATHWYSLSTDLNADWDRTHVYQPKLKAYWKDLVVKYKLGSNITFFTKVAAAEWDEKRQEWRVELVDLNTGKTRVEFAKVVVSAIGVLDTPHYPDELKGIQTRFKGEHFHSARWDHNIDLRNKRVAVIGNGCSANQFVPIISEDPTTQVMSFCRTPPWVLPKWQKPIPTIQRQIFRYVPFVMRLHRWSLLLIQEMYYILLLSSGPNNKRNQATGKDLVAYMKSIAPEKYHNDLIPKYPVGCKRFVVDSGYYEALQRPNNDLTYDKIAEVTEKGILTKSGKHYDFDVIIQATGFIADEYPIKIRGSEGTTIQDYFREKGGPTAYRGTTVPGFPNYYTVFGANTATGHASVVFTEEVQVDYIVQMLEPVLKGLASSFEITHAATDAWNHRIHSKLENSVWSACQSWYRAGHKGKNTNIWPGLILEQWWMLHTPQWEHYKAVGAERWRARRTRRAIWAGVKVAGVVAAVAWAYLHPVEATDAVHQTLDLLNVQWHTLRQYIAGILS